MADSTCDDFPYLGELVIIRKKVARGSRRHCGWESLMGTYPWMQSFAGCIAWPLYSKSLLSQLPIFLFLTSQRTHATKILITGHEFPSHRASYFHHPSISTTRQHFKFEVVSSFIPIYYIKWLVWDKIKFSCVQDHVKTWSLLLSSQNHKI